MDCLRYLLTKYWQITTLQRQLALKQAHVAVDPAITGQQQCSDAYSIWQRLGATLFASLNQYGLNLHFASSTQGYASHKSQQQRAYVPGLLVLLQDYILALSTYEIFHFVKLEGNFIHVGHGEVVGPKRVIRRILIHEHILELLLGGRFLYLLFPLAAHPLLTACMQTNTGLIIVRKLVNIILGELMELFVMILIHTLSPKVMFWPAKFLILSLLALSAIDCACPPDPNPALISQVPNGQKLLIGDLDDPQGNYLYIAKLKGTPYQMGKAFGKLFEQELKEQIKTFYNYYDVILAEMIMQGKLPTFLKKSLAKHSAAALNAVLDLNVQITREYTNKRYFQQIKGIAEGANMSAKPILRMNLLPELIKAACTVAGIWKNASSNNQTLHMRALDWDAANPINKYPIALVYHPSGAGLNKHVNFAWIGFVGSLTGVSQKISIGEKVWLPPKNSVKMTRFGNPWTYVLRDILYDADNLPEALDILINARRTCAIHLGIASAPDHSFRMLEYSYKTLNIYDDQNYTNYNATSHPKMNGIAFFDKHVQPSRDDCVGQLLINKDYYGRWNIDNFWRVVGNTHKTGNTQLVVFNLQRQQALISYSRNIGNKTEDAFHRSPIQIDLNQLWTDF